MRWLAFGVLILVILTVSFGAATSAVPPGG